MSSGAAFSVAAASPAAAGDPAVSPAAGAPGCSVEAALRPVGGIGSEALVDVPADFPFVAPSVVPVGPGEAGTLMTVPPPGRQPPGAGSFRRPRTVRS